MNFWVSSNLLIKKYRMFSPTFTCVSGAIPMATAASGLGLTVLILLSINFFWSLFHSSFPFSPTPIQYAQRIVFAGSVKSTNDRWVLSALDLALTLTVVFSTSGYVVSDFTS